MSSQKVRNICFTLNNYTDEELTSIEAALSDETEVAYAVYGRETAPETGTPHLQGYVRFKKPKRFHAIKEYLNPRIHLEVRRGTEGQAAKYCKKDGDFVEHGVISTPGKRSDIDALIHDIDSGERDMKKLRRAHPLVMAKYPKFASQMLHDTRDPLPLRAEHELRAWQRQLYDDLAKPVDDRKVIFIVDTVGNCGKSWFARYCEFKDPTGVFILKPSKKDDMAYMVPEDPPLRVVFMDCARSATEFLQYSFLEDLKDGRVSCPKYESFIKFLPPIHVVVLMNQEPDMTKLSEDRYDIRFISVDENDPPIPRRVLPANAPGFNPGP